MKRLSSRAPTVRYYQRYVDSVECSGRFSVNMWAWISVDSPGVILYAEERPTSDVYIRILENVMLPLLWNHILQIIILFFNKIIVRFTRRGIWREHSSKKWIRPRFSVDLIKGLQMSRAKLKLTQIFHLSSGVPLIFFWGQFL
jgi:hypothetical protein